MPVTILITDLIFSTKITSTAQSLNIPFTVVRSLEKLTAALTASPGGTLIIDLNITAVDPLAAIKLAKTLPTPPRIIAFLSHIQTDLAAAAQNAGADLVLPRSAFSAKLPEILTSLK